MPIETSESSATENRRQPFPGTSQEQLGALLAAFNTGVTAATFLLIPEHGYIAVPDFVQAFRRVFAETEVAGFSRATPLDYCRRSLGPIGLVTSDYTIPYFGTDQLVGVGLTQEGIELGIPTASLVLGFERDNSFPIYPALGRTSTNSPDGTRAPLNRAGILDLLRTSPAPLRREDIINQLGINPTVAQQSLVALHQAGVAEYTSIKHRTGKKQITYELGTLDITLVHMYKRGRDITREVAEICKLLSSRGDPITQKAVYERLTANPKYQWEEENMHSYVTGILSDLAKQGFLKRDQFKGGETLSSASITDKGRVLVDQLIHPIKDIVNGVRVNIPDARPNLSALARNSAKLYYPYSFSFRITSRAGVKSRIVEALAAAEKGVSIPTLMEQTGMNKETLRGYLVELTEAGKVTRVENNSVFYYQAS